MNAQAHTLPAPVADAANDAAAPALRVSVSVSEEFMSVDSYDARGVPNGRYRLTVPAEVPEGCTPTDARVLRMANHDLAGELHRLRTLFDQRPTIVDAHPSYIAWTEQVYASDKAAGVPAATVDAAPAGRFLPVVEMREPAPEPFSFREAFEAIMPKAKPLSFMPELQAAVAAGLADGTLSIMGDQPEAECHCEACEPQGNGLDIPMRMIVCATCGNKRCPHATDHRNACTDSNEPGQPGSSYAHVPRWPTSGLIVLIEPEPDPTAAFRREHLGTPFAASTSAPAVTIKALALKVADSFLAIEIAGDIASPTSPLWPPHHANEKALDDAISELLRPAREPSTAEREAARVLATSPMARTE